MENEIIEGNKLIARFMGYSNYDDGNPNFNPEDWYTGKDVVYARYSDLQYHSSWDWLMPVVEKIDGLCIYSEETNRLTINGLSIFAEIKVVYHAVIEFIKWYNNHKQTV